VLAALPSGVRAALEQGDVAALGAAQLPQLEENGWRLSDPVRRIWAGERDVDALTAGIDGNSAQLVRRVLDLVEAG
jgi:hypothetical protein